METQTAVTKKSLYDSVNSFFTGQAIGQVIVNMTSACLVGLVAVGYRWAWHSRNFKSNGGQLEREMLRQLIRTLPEEHLQRQASQGRTMDREAELTEAELMDTEEELVAEVDIAVVIEEALTAGELQNVRSAMPSDQVTEISGSHVFQTSISFEEGHLADGLRGLLKNLASTESCTIQLGHWGVFDQGENRLERFMDKNLPILVMCTRIADDNKINICGSHLKGEGPSAISVYAATAERKHALDVTWDEDEILPGVERGVASLPSEFVDIGDICIYATKTVPAGRARKPTTFRSQAIPLRNIEHVAPLKWSFILLLGPFILELLVYVLVYAFFYGVLQALVVASVCLTAWGLFGLTLEKVLNLQQKYIFALGPRKQLRGLSINSDTTEIIQPN